MEYILLNLILKEKKEIGI